MNNNCSKIKWDSNSCYLINNDGELIHECNSSSMVCVDLSISNKSSIKKLFKKMILLFIK